MKLRLVLVLLALFALPMAGHAQSFLSTSEETQSSDAPADTKAIDALLEVLQDENQRNALIERLQKLDGNSANDQGTAAEAQDAPTFARQVANITIGAAESAYDTVQMVWRDLTGIRAVTSGISDQKAKRIAENAPGLFGIIIVTLALLWVLTRLFGRMKNRHLATDLSFWGHVRIVVINAFSDLLALAVAYAGGYFIALAVFGGGNIAVEVSLYLNAFLAAGVVRIIIRLFVLPDRPEQAIFNFSGPIQRAIYYRVRSLSALLVYGVNAIVPITNIWISFVVGRSLHVIIVTTAAIYALYSIRKIAQKIEEERQERARIQVVENQSDEEEDLGELVEVASEETADATLRFWHKVWPWLGTIYVAFAYIIAITRPNLMADLVGSATIKTLIAMGAAALAFRFIKNASEYGTPVPHAIQNALPELKDRLDGMMPYAMRIASLLLIIIAAGFVLDAWNLFDVSGWATSPFGADIISRFLSALLIVVIIFSVWAVIASIIDNRLTLSLEGRNVNARSRTLLSLFRNAFTVALFVFGAMTTLSQLGIDIAPLLAGAGVIGLAIGFGSQKLVQDIITGIFIQLDNAINEGDVVTIGGITGTVEKLTIRSAGMRDLHGTYHIVPFSSVDTVSNFMRKFGYHVAEVGVAYKERITDVKDAMQEAFERLKQTEHGPFIMGELEMHGVTALADSSVNVRARIKTRPGKQWAAGREYTQLVKEVFDERNIEIPYPHRQMVYADKPGS